MFGHLLKRGAAMLCLAAVLALPAYAEGRITTDMTMKEIRSDPAIAGSGVSTYCKGDADSLALRRLYENKTLLDYVGETTAQDSADGKYALVVGGNAAMKSGDLNEGIAVAAKLNEMGYSVFVLRYRIWWDLGNNGPLQDLGRAVQFITNHAQQFGVQPENYALVGFSSGGQLCGLFSSDKRYGYKAYDVPKPGALLMGYPVNDFAEIKPVYHAVMDPASCRWRYYWSDISGGITPDFPPTYFWYGKNDVTLKTLGYPFQGPAVRKALEANGVPCEVHVYENAPHAIGTGNGTDAEGWMTDAVAFWEQHTS